MSHTDFKIIGVMSRRNFNNTRTEIRFNIFVRHNGYFAVNKRKNKGFADKVLIPFVVRVNRDRSISEQRFGAGGRKL